MSKVCYNGKYPAEAFDNRDGKLFCIECGEWLPIVMFRKRRNTKRGYNMCCKRCYTTSAKNCNGEVWIDVVGFEGFYKVSRTGKILSCERIIFNKGKSVYLPAKIHNQRPNVQGYLTAVLSKDGHSKNFLVHRLVAMAFLPNPNRYDCVNLKMKSKLIIGLKTWSGATRSITIIMGQETQEYPKSIVVLTEVLHRLQIW